MEPKSPRHGDLVRKGWVRQFSASNPRLEEAVGEYRDLGFEVLVEPPDISAPSGTCASCLMDNPDFVKVIYTRRDQIE